MGVIRKTKSVKSIIAAFEKSSAAISVVDLVQRFSNDMNKTTVYRILERLEEEGILHSFTGKNGLKWVAKLDEKSRSNQKDHAHFQCEECGKSECLDVDISIPKVTDHKINSTNLILVGQCKDCIS